MPAPTLKTRQKTAITLRKLEDRATKLRDDLDKLTASMREGGFEDEWLGAVLDAREKMLWAFWNFHRFARDMEIHPTYGAAERAERIAHWSHVFQNDRASHDEAARQLLLLGVDVTKAGHEYDSAVSSRMARIAHWREVFQNTPNRRDEAETELRLLGVDLRGSR